MEDCTVARSCAIAPEQSDGLGSHQQGSPERHPRPGHQPRQRGAGHEVGAAVAFRLPITFVRFVPSVTGNM